MSDETPGKPGRKPGKPLLTEQMRRFAEIYDGNGLQSARAAGAEGDDNTCAAQAYKWLRRPDVQALIEARRVRELRPKVMDRRERQEMWSAVARDVAEPTETRLRASELLAKSEGDFVVKIDANVTGLRLPTGLSVEEIRQIARLPLSTERPADAVLATDQPPAQ